MSADLLANAVAFRLILAGTIIFLGILLYKTAGKLTLARARVQARAPERSANAASGPAAATLLYFTTPACAPCKTVQRPAIQRLREQVGDALDVIEIDASQQPDLASQWGVLSVPTTFVLDAHGNPRHVNYGVATTDKLLRQIQELAPFHGE